MQVVTWSGQGNGSLTSPFLLNKPDGFNELEPFNILLTNNYIDSQNESNYFKFSDSLTIYTLAYIISNRDSLMYIQSRDAIKVTMFLTDKTDYLDGPYIITTYGGTVFLAKQQIFEPPKEAYEGYYRGIWVSGEVYDVNDTVVYDEKMYVCITANADIVFNEDNWIAVGGIKLITSNISPTVNDYDYDLGTLWINTENNYHFILVDNTIDAAVWNASIDVEGRITTLEQLVAEFQAEELNGVQLFTSEPDESVVNDGDIWFDFS